MFRRFLCVAASLAAICGGGLALAPTASASQYGCPGNGIDAYPVYDSNDGTWISNIELYYDPATGANCAVNRRTRLGEFGSPAWMLVQIWADGGSVATDSGTFSTQAGPVSTRASGVCVNVRAITYTASGRYGETQRRGHCG